MLKVVKMPPLPQNRNRHSNKHISEKAMAYNGIIVEPKIINSNQSISLSSRRYTPQRPFSSKSSKSIKSTNSTEKEILLRADSTKGKQGCQMPNVSARSWVVFQMKQNRCLYGKRNFKKRQIASLTKIMNLITILSIVESFKLDASKIKAKVSQKISITIGTTAGLKQNAFYRLEDLYYGMMLPSGNDAALMIAVIGGCLMKLSLQGTLKQKVYNQQIFSNILAEQQSGLASSYLRQMNRLSKQIGMFNSNFANAHGLSNVYSFSTASDVAKLCSFAMKNGLFRKIVKTECYNYILSIKNEETSTNSQDKENFNPNYLQKVLKSQNQGKWENTNKLLSEGWSGIKTGITPNAGPCLAASYLTSIAGREYQFAVVLLKSKSMEARWQQAKAIVDWVIENKLYQHSN